MSAKTCKWQRGSRPRCTVRAVGQGYCYVHYYAAIHLGLIRGGLVDAGEARDYITEHLARRNTYHGIATATGLARHHIAQIHRGDHPTIRVATHDAIMGVPLPPTTIGCLRRVQALRRAGHTLRGIAIGCGIQHTTLVASLERGWFTHIVARRIADGYDRMSGTPGQSKRAVALAARDGFAPPMAWDGIDIDDPAAAPDFGAETKRSTFELAAEAKWLRGGGMSKERIAKALRVKPCTIEQAEYLARKQRQVAA